MKSVKVSISFPKASELQKQLDQVVSKMNNTLKIDLDTKSFNKSLSDMSNLISKLKSQLADFNILEKLDGDGTSVAKTAKEVNNLAEAMGKLNEQSQLRKKKDDETWALKDIQAYNKAMDDNYKTQIKLEKSLENIKNNLQNKLNIANGNSFVDTSVIDKLQNKLNSLNTNTPEKEINELKSAINNLSSADSGIVRIQNAVIRLQERISQIKKNKLDMIDTSEIVELKQAETELSKLQSMMSQLKAGDVIDGKAISNQINIANSSVKSLENQFKSMNNTASGLETTIRNIFSYVIGGSAFYAVMNSMKNAIETTVELDDALRDLRRVTELTDSEYSNFMKTANQTAIALGTTTAGAIEATTRFSQLGYSFSEASEELSKYALVLSNVADMSAKDASSSIVSVLKGFQMGTEDVSKIVDVINEAGNKFAIDSSGLADALKVGAANLSLAGNDLEQASALIITANEVMQDPTTVSNGLRTIGMRLRGVSEDGEELSATMNELIKSMTGVSVEGLDGELRSTYDILKDIGEVWDTLNTKQQELLSSEIAGKNRANVFASLMQNAEQLEKAYDTLKDSAGSALTEQEAYMDSLSGRINALKESFTAITMQIVDSDFLKGFISSMTTGVNVVSGFIDVFGTMPTIITAVIAGLTVFNNKFRESTNSMLLAIPGYGNLITSMSKYEKSLKVNIESIREQIISLKKQQTESLASGQAVNTLGVKMVGLNGKLALTTAGLISTKLATVALQTVMSVGLSLAISAVIGVVSSFVSSLMNADEATEKVNASAKELSDTLTSVSDSNIDLKTYRELNEKLKDAKLTEEERNDLNNQLVEVKEKLYSIDDEAYAILNNQNLTYQEQLDLLRAINDEKLKERGRELDKSLGNGFWRQDEGTNAKQSAEMLENQIALYKEADELFKHANGEWIQLSNGAMVATKNQREYLEDLKNSILENSNTVQKYNSNVELIKKTNADTNRSTVELSDSVRNFISDLNASTDAINENTQAKEKNAQVNNNNESSDTQVNDLSNLQRAYESLGYSVDDVKDKMEDLQELSFGEQNSQLIADSTEVYNESKNKVQELKEALEDLNEEQAVSSQLISELANTYPDILKLGSSIYDLSSVQEFLNSQIEAQAQIQATAYENMISYDTEYYNNKIKNNEEFMQLMQDSINSFTDMQGQGYELDFNNFSNLHDLKNGILNQFGDVNGNILNAILEMYAKSYTFDSNNFADLQSMKQGYLNQLLPAIANWIASK